MPAYKVIPAPVHRADSRTCRTNVRTQEELVHLFSRRATRRTWQIAFLFALAIAITAPAALAQILYGSITGVVKDPQGGTVPGATVTIVNKETNLTKDT